MKIFAVLHMRQYRSVFSDIDPEIDAAYLDSMGRSAVDASQR